ncbi:MAG TPA: alpha/beta hydrolase [Caulobacteraceae bacterium]|jgi:pimeloyl-ACP methyl ester carboxylesterase|nr:alpha/beta hydrolase [Caulobacteraceae bacterium]
MLTERAIHLRHGPELKVVVGGSGPPLVWLHGMAAPEPSDELLNALTERFEVFAPVAPGVGGLEELAELPTLHDLVLLYDGLLAELGIERAVLVGHGFGGMLAAELAALAPHRVGRLVLVSPLGLWSDAHPIEDIFARRQPQVEELIWSGSQRRPTVALSEDDAIEAYIRFANALGAMANYTWPIPDRGLKRRLYRITASTLVLGARSDAWIPPAYAEDFAAAIDGARAAHLEGSHMAPYEDPGAFAQAIAGFVG